MAPRRLTIYLFRGSVREPDEALDKTKRPRVVSLAAEGDLEGVFAYKAPRGAEPAWVGFVRPLLGEGLRRIRTSTASGALILKRGGRVFAFTFGYGRALLDLSRIEHQFGLRVALNRIDPRQIRSIDTKTFEDMVLTTSTQASRSAELPAFGVDVATDILRAVTGEPRDSSIAKRLTGADALVISSDAQPKDLPELCDKVLRAYRDDSYKNDFGWIDHLALVRDSSRVYELNKALVERLRQGETESIHLAMPEPLPWEDVDSFRIEGARTREFDELDLEEYLEAIEGSRKDLTPDLLRSRGVLVRYTRSTEYDRRWSLYQCLVAEQRYGGSLYALIEGRWFEVSDSLVRRVDEFLASVPASTLGFPAARPGESEPAYNRRLAEHIPNLLHLDARIVRPDGASSGIEFCDAFSTDGEIIHVKRKNGSPSLSHLFAQGTVSAATFLGDEEFRKKVRSAIVKSCPDNAQKWLELVPADQRVPERSRYNVTFAVIAKGGDSGRAWLPFFSRLNFMNHGRQLRNLGVEVSLARIPIEEPPPGSPRLGETVELATEPIA